MAGMTRRQAQSWIKTRRQARRDMRRSKDPEFKRIAARYCRLATRMLDQHYSLPKSLEAKRRKDSKRYFERDNPLKR